MAKVIAIFDLEGTLCESGGLLWRAILKKNIRWGYGVCKLILNTLLQIGTVLCYKVRLVDARTVRRMITKSMATLLKGFAEDEVNQHAQLIAEKYTASLRPVMGKVLINHISKGHTVVLISGMFQPYLEAVGRKLGAELIVGTKLETRSGHYTGRLNGSPCVGEQRVNILKELIEEMNIQDYKRSEYLGLVYDGHVSKGVLIAMRLGIDTTVAKLRKVIANTNNEIQQYHFIANDPEAVKEFILKYPILPHDAAKLALHFAETV